MYRHVARHIDDKTARPISGSERAAGRILRVVVAGLAACAIASFGAVTIVTMCFASQAGQRPTTGAERPKTPLPGVSVRAVGVLKTGRLAIGGETTGTTLTCGDLTVELVINSAELESAKNKLANQRACVAGRLIVIKGVERPPRLVITHIRRLRSPKKSAKPRDAVTVEATGILRTGRVAIGGGHTGTSLEAGKLTFEIAWPDKKLAAQAESFKNKTVTVSGRLQRKDDPERGLRLIISAEKLKQSPDEKPPQTERREPPRDGDTAASAATRQPGARRSCVMLACNCPRVDDPATPRWRSSGFAVFGL